MSAGWRSRAAIWSHTTGSMSGWLTLRNWQRRSGSSVARRRVHS